MSNEVTVAVIGFIGILITAVLGVLANDVKKVKRHAAATEHSINNRPTSLSDRLDVVLSAVEDVKAQQESHGKDIRGFRQDIGELRGEDRRLRSQLSRQVEAMGPLMPMLKDLHQQYSTKQKGRR